jgi:hypothetical protein
VQLLFEKLQLRSVVECGESDTVQLEKLLVIAERKLAICDLASHVNEQTQFEAVSGSSSTTSRSPRATNPLSAEATPIDTKRVTLQYTFPPVDW